MTFIKTRFLDFKLIAYTNGLLLLVLATTLGLIGGLTHWSQDAYDLAFFGAAFTTAFFGGLLVLGNRGKMQGRISIHTSYLLTFSCWIVLALFSTLPLYLSGVGLSYTDTVFETVSALTTTGSTVLTGLDTMSKDLLL